MKLPLLTSVLAVLAAAAQLVDAVPSIPHELNEREIARISQLPRHERVKLAERILEIRTAYEYEKQLAARHNALEKRASPSGSFAPANMPCPNTTSQQGPGFIRNARTKQLNADEANYISRRRTESQQAWKTWLEDSAKLDSALPGGASNYTSDTDRLPRLAFALSGGGLRAMLVGSGTLQGFDGRNATANQRGTGGLLQLAEYVAGLSGGSWATASLAMNNWATTQSLKDDVWNLESNLVVPEDGKVSFYASIIAAVAGKRTEGYQTSLTDYFGLSIADKILNGSTYGNKFSVEWSDLKNTSAFTSASMPFPIIIADEREPGELIIPRNTTIWEFSPYEFGSWNPNVSAFIPIEILGSSLNNGSSVLPGGECVGGYQTVAWVTGTSATLFSGLYLSLVSSSSDSVIVNALKEIAQAVSNEQNDVSTVPNPFYGFDGTAGQTLEVTKLMNITLVDGGLDNENVPLWPLVEPARGLDAIIAIDSSADVTNWPNGSALYQTSLRAQYSSYSQYAFPVVPDTNTIVNRGLNTRPVFYGCNANVNVTNADTAFNNSKTPIVIYLPSYPYSALANTSTFKLDYSDSEAQGVIDNSVDVASLGGADSQWATCLGCALAQRGFERSSTPRPEVCDQCMKKWCWDGITNASTPSYSYSPAIGVPQFVTSNGTLQQTPAFTGGNGSNSQAGDASSQSAANAKNAAAAQSPAFAIAIAAAAALALSLTLL
ncbi:lysophospholipase Plb2 [Moesziomyces antarcticus]|uniref:Lysophospholipase n=1 Tax=Pseudozyma antarctica TaxID=84753 RepID=A0A5C3FGP2_PSEA2|nr:lysophospholipase Plb2 [Moesziomyces antarcticus]GAK62946.1 lysophospholipase Plb2 [Moesziomyces antarcticus]SPO43574.1 probable lysophospholipase (lpl) [Moesziomyces antarcticus]